MKKLVIGMVGVMALVMFTACGSEEPIEDLTLSDPNENVIVEEIEVEEIQVEEIQIEEIQVEGCQDPEYLRELEYNSQHNVYHGDWDNVTSWDDVTETW